MLKPVVAQEQYVLPPVEKGGKKLPALNLPPRTLNKVNNAEWGTEANPMDDEERKFLELVGEPDLPKKKGAQLIKVQEQHQIGKENWNEDSNSLGYSQEKPKPVSFVNRSEDDFNELLNTSPKKKRGGHQSHAKEKQWEELEEEAERGRQN